MADRTVVITGASDGIGAAAARALAAMGDRVVVVGRSPGKTKAVAAELGAPFHLADYADLAQVRTLAGELLTSYPRIDVLANNAGGLMGPDKEVTQDGFEKTFQVDHLAPFLLTRLLMERLIESRATVITTASLAHRGGRLQLDNLNFERGYSAGKAYGTAKLENILFSAELHRRHAQDGIQAASFHPGVIASNFASGAGPITRALYSWPLNTVMGSNEQGADTLIWLATTQPGTDWQPGGYYAKRRPARMSRAASDPELARQLWDRSAELVT